MSISFTYTQLNAALQSWEAEDDSNFVSEIPTFIGKAELRTLRDLNLTIFDAEDSSATVQGNRLVAKDASWFVTRDLYIIVSGAHVRLEEKTKSYCLEYAPVVATEGVPEYFYEASDTDWYVVPTPNGVYTVAALIGSRPAGLAPANDETWLGNNCGDLLHALAMKEAALYLKQGAKEVLWETEYQKALATARLELRDLIRSDYTPVKSAAQRI
jgi:hypothetical protein